MSRGGFWRGWLSMDHEWYLEGWLTYISVNLSTAPSITGYRASSS